VRLSVLLAIAISLFTPTTPAEDWPQFRGPGGRAVSETATPPVGFGPTSNLVWKVTIPEGYSSPIVTGRRIFLTAATEGKLETLGLDRKDGRVLWRKPVSADKPDPTKNLQATSTPVTDGKFVYAFFGSFGLVAYDLEGVEQWRQPLAKPDLEANTSPILIHDKLIIVCDREAGSFIEAHDAKTGRTLWRAERPQFLRSRATPFHWVHGKAEELIVPGSFRLTSYDPLTGRENWGYSGAARFATSSPAAGENLLFSASSSYGVGEGGGGDGSVSVPLVPYSNQSTKPKPPKAESAVLAIRPGGSGDLAETQLAWKSTNSPPYASSPLYYQGRLFTIKEGGLLSAYAVKNGHPIYQDEPINAPGDYWASAVAAAGRIYFSSHYGAVTVINATTDKPVILAQNKLGEEILATPALYDQTILLRTATNLYSFGTDQ